MIGNISEEKQHTLEEFIYNTTLILGALNYKVLVPIVETNIKQNSAPKNLFYLQRKNRAAGITIQAKGQKTRDGFVVLKGSYIVEADMKAIPEKIQQLRQSAKINKDRILQEDLLFNSPSYAAAFVIGGNANGLMEWKTKDGIPLKNILND